MEDFLISESNSCRYDGIGVINKFSDMLKEDKSAKFRLEMPFGNEFILLSKSLESESKSP
jgi:hypothetical protein